MILKLTLAKDKKNNIVDKPALYNPSPEVKDRTFQVINDFQSSDEIRSRPYREFNDNTLIDRQSMDQMSFNQYINTGIADPAEEWKSRAFRPIVRNKLITIAAHITASVIFPKIYAQNDADQEDRDAAIVMRDLMEWTADQSHYDKTFLRTVIAALINPAAIVHTEYAERMRTIKDITGVDEKGKLIWVEKEILDDEFSGFIDQVVPCDELWISNIYEHEIQKQPYLIWRRVIDYATACSKYYGNENFEKYVRPGVQYLYSDEQRTFYEQYDQELQGRLVEEIIYYNRNADLQITFVNGVLLDDVNSPNPRKDKKYPFAKTGYELIDEGRFFYYKSLPFKLGPDEEVVNTLYRMIIDGTYLQIMPPAVLFGDQEIGKTVIAPGTVTTIPNAQNPNQSFQTLATNNNLAAGFNTLEKVESSISESSSDILQTGMPLGGQQTAFEIARLEQNARVMLGLFGKMIGFLVREFGYLRIGDILQYMTIGEVTEIESPNGLLKFRTFIMPDKMIDGKNRTRKIDFDMNLPEEATDEDFMNQSISIAEEEDELGDDVRIMKVNPEKFRKLKFQCVVNAEAMLPRSEAMQKVLQLEEYGLAIANPYTNHESVTRDLLLGSFEKTKYDPDKYMQSEMPQNPQPGQSAQPLPGEASMTEQEKPLVAQYLADK